MAESTSREPTAAEQSKIQQDHESAERALRDRRFEDADKAATDALQVCLDVYGAGSAELVPSYMFLIRANLGLMRNKQVEQYLALANWSILNNPNCGHELRSQLHRFYGKLYAVQGRHDEALRQLATDVYYASLSFGPEHVETSPGYFHLGLVFQLQSREAKAGVMFAKVVEIWHSYITALLTSDTDEEVDELYESRALEGVEMLTNILDFRTKLLGADHPESGKVHAVLGMLHQFWDDGRDKALLHTKRALEIFEKKLHGDDPLLAETRRSLAAQMS